ncbi:MAG: RluA family pseudouridine synthase [Candidatus Omnitrophica bacterium]|nr:RluA family pseudouridine synthase [Candidatus Omnitrophota bacterium]
MDYHPQYKINNIAVVYEDNWLMVVEKPSGLLTIPTPKKEARTLTSILNLYPCHRLDRETSGLIIYAKGKSIQRKMMRAFKERKIKKRYIAFVRGCPEKPKGKISYPLEGHQAITRYKVIKKYKNFAVVEVEPLTGRTNQIRIHFKKIGHPILGETKYAFRRDFILKAKRLCLHAKELEFIHPVTGREISLTSDLPPYLKEFLIRHD